MEGQLFAFVAFRTAGLRPASLNLSALLLVTVLSLTIAILLALRDEESAAGDLHLGFRPAGRSLDSGRLRF